MDARILRAALFAAVLGSLGASHRTQNFIVSAPTRQIAEQVGEAAEAYRRDLAVDWLGNEMPPWSQPCPITVQVGERMGAGGATSFVFDRGEVFGWQMTIQGSLERVLDSVLPHEITHTIFASHFRQPLPRWADEGACTTVEHPAERNKQQQMLIQFLKTGRGIPFSTMFALKEYPPDVLPLYAQGHSLAGFLMAQGGKRKFLQFVADGLNDENWPAVVARHYGYENLRTLQSSWLDWVSKGSPAIEPPSPGVLLASNAASPPVRLSAAVQTASPNGAAGSPPLADGLNRWVATEQSARRRTRPQPNLVYHEKSEGASAQQAGAADGVAAAPSDVIGAGSLVAVDLQSARNASAGAPLDPFSVAAAASASGAVPVRTGASRLQPPQTPGQIVLEWTRPQAPPIPWPASAYSSGLPRNESTTHQAVLDAAANRAAVLR